MYFNIIYHSEPEYLQQWEEASGKKIQINYKWMLIYFFLIIIIPNTFFPV